MSVFWWDMVGRKAYRGVSRIVGWTACHSVLNGNYVFEGGHIRQIV